MAEQVLFNVKELLRDLNNLDPQLTKELRKEAKGAVKGMQRAIKLRIQRIEPLKGMLPENNPTGRLAWDAGKKSDTVVIKFRSGRSRTRAVTPLVSLWVTSPMTALADTAGKGNLRAARTISREYAYKGGRRRHRIAQGSKGMNGGADFVMNLKRHDANDFIYGEVEASIPMTEREIKLIFERYATKVNRKLN